MVLLLFSYNSHVLKCSISPTPQHFANNYNILFINWWIQFILFIYSFNINEVSLFKWYQLFSNYKQSLPQQPLFFFFFFFLLKLIRRTRDWKLLYPEDFLVMENSQTVSALSVTVTKHWHWRLLSKMLHKHFLTVNAIISTHGFIPFMCSVLVNQGFAMQPELLGKDLSNRAHKNKAHS